MDGSRAPTSRHGSVIPMHPLHRSPLLALGEVRECGSPAVFMDYGEALLYMDGHLFSLREIKGEPGHALLLPPPLPPQVLESGVGLEYGWRHLAGCNCRFCRDAVAALVA